MRNFWIGAKVLFIVSVIITLFVVTFPLWTVIISVLFPLILFAAFLFALGWIAFNGISIFGAIVRFASKNKK